MNAFSTKKASSKDLISLRNQVVDAIAALDPIKGFKMLRSETIQGTLDALDPDNPQHVILMDDALGYWKNATAIIASM